MAIGRLRTALEEDYRDNIYKRGLSRTDPRQCCLSDEDTFVWSNEFIKKVTYVPWSVIMYVRLAVPFQSALITHSLTHIFSFPK